MAADDSATRAASPRTSEIRKFPGGTAHYEWTKDGPQVTWQPDAGDPVTEIVPGGRRADYWDWFREERLPGLLALRGEE